MVILDEVRSPSDFAIVPLSLLKSVADAAKRLVPYEKLFANEPEPVLPESMEPERIEDGSD